MALLPGRWLWSRWRRLDDQHGVPGEIMYRSSGAGDYCGVAFHRIRHDPINRGQSQTAPETPMPVTFQQVLKRHADSLMIASAMHLRPPNGFTAFTGAFMVAERASRQATIGLIFSAPARVRCRYVLGDGFQRAILVPIFCVLASH